MLLLVAFHKKHVPFFGGPGPPKLSLLMNEIESNEEGVEGPHLATVTHYYIVTLEIYILQIQAMPLATTND